MSVWVLQVDVYEDRHVKGVYSTPEAGMAAWPKGKWGRDEDGDWCNDEDFGDFATLIKYDVVGPRETA